MQTISQEEITIIPKYAGLLKFGEYQHMLNFYEKGEMYFNTFDFFRKLEITGDGRADKNEYCTYHYSGEGIQSLRLKMFPHGKENEAIEVVGGKDLIELTLNTNENVQYTHLYSLSAINLEWSIKNNCIIDSRNFAPKKDYVVPIFKSDVFIDRVIKEIEILDCNAKLGFVDYVDKKNYTGEMGPFRKFDNYSYQNEYRIALNLKKDNAFTIHIGSLADIAWEPQEIKKFYSSDCSIEYTIEQERIRQNITNQKI